MSSSSNRRVARPVQKQLIQSLENRRLMSLTGGFDLQPPGLPPADSTDMPFSRGFDQSPAAVGGGMPGLGQPSPVPQMFQGPDQIAPDAPAAAGDALSFTATTAEPTKIAVTSATTLSSLYSTLGNSTVAQIDAASAKSVVSNLDESLAFDTHGSVITAVGPTSSATFAQLSSATAQVAESTTLSRSMQVPFENSDAALARALSVVAPPVAMAMPVLSAPGHEEFAPSWMLLRKLEGELLAVREVANQIVTEISRDSAIALSHLQSLMESETVSVIAGNSFAAWRSVAVAGSIIAGGAYVQSKSTSEKQKPANLFSSQLIEVVRT